MKVSHSQTVLIESKDLNSATFTGITADESFRPSSVSPKKIRLRVSSQLRGDKTFCTRPSIKTSFKGGEIGGAIQSSTTNSSPVEKLTRASTSSKIWLRVISTASTLKDRPPSSQMITKLSEPSLTQMVTSNNDDRPITAISSNQIQSKLMSSIYQTKSKGNILTELLKEKRESKPRETDQVYDKLSDIMTKCRKLNQEVSRVEKKISRGQDAYLQTMNNIQVRSRKVRGKFEFWKTDAEFRVNRDKMKTELEKFRNGVRANEVPQEKDNTNNSVWDPHMDQTNGEQTQTDSNIIENFILKESRAVKPKKTTSLDERYTRYLNNQQSLALTLPLGGESSEMSNILRKETSLEEGKISPTNSMTKSQKKTRLAMHKFFNQPSKPVENVKALVSKFVKASSTKNYCEDQEMLEELQITNREIPSYASKNKSTSPNKLEAQNEKITRKQNFILHQIQMIKLKKVTSNYEMDFCSFKKMRRAQWKNQSPTATEAKN